MSPDAADPADVDAANPAPASDPALSTCPPGTGNAAERLGDGSPSTGKAAAAERLGEGSSGRPPLLVSACLLGRRCTYKGGAETATLVLALADRWSLLPICPEVEGGLPVPRPRAERQPDGRVITADGHDVSDAYQRGAAAALALARRHGAVAAVLKSRSPSCGCREIYDGTFTRALRPGVGVTAEVLVKAGIEVLSEEDLGAGLLPNYHGPASPEDQR